MPTVKKFFFFDQYLRNFEIVRWLKLKKKMVEVQVHKVLKNACPVGATLKHARTVQTFVRER